MKTDNLWKNYKETGNLELRNQLIENYIGLVRIVAGRMYNFYGTKIDFDDLLGYGVLGLMDSIEKFDITKNVKFETYAQIRIRGEIIDNIRKQDWIPRTLRKRSREIQEIVFKLENELGRKPNKDEVAEELEITIKELEENLSDMSTFNVSSLEDLLAAQGDYAMGVTDNAIKTPEEAYVKKDIENILKESIDELEERERIIISLYYYEDLTYKEIGEVLELSESRISQIHSKSIIDIKNSLKKQGIN